jgi:dextranase
MKIEALPVRSTYQRDEQPQVEIRGLAEPGMLRVFHLGDPVVARPVEAGGIASLPSLPPGGYGIELSAGNAVARTAIEVVADGSARMRYGFVADYRPGRAVEGVRDNIRRLHLTDIQFYDWAYRHADLMGGGEEYADALGQKISLATVRALVAAVRSTGARALGYAAVYGVGNAEWSTWADAALLTPAGEPYGLGDFLRLVDPAEPRWLAHFTSDLRAATDRLGFDGFHLDQYGYPKYATRPDDVAVRVEDSFAALIAAARAALPSSRLVFNNVNTFPMWRTAGTAQDAVYVEVWAPHSTLDHVARVVRDAQASGGGKPVVVAAYQQVYATADAATADLAAAFTMATLFSHGATHLLCGEADRVLVDPYYVRNHEVEASTAAHLVRWYDFLVEHGELLNDPSLTEMTGALGGSYNDDCDVTYPDIEVTEAATAGTIWRRIVGSGDRLIVHLINLCGQDNTEWDTPRAPIERLPPGVLRIRRAGANLPRVRVADPDRQARLRDLPVVADGDYARVDVPAPYVWQMLVIDLRPALDVVEM